MWEVRNNEAPVLNNPLAQYNPKLDEQGVLRVYARLRTAEHLPEGARCPVLLHKAHPTTRALLETIHRQDLKHMGGPKALMAEFNLNYFCHGGMSLARRIVKGCVTCLKRKPHISRQPEAPLPNDRVQDGKTRLAPFATTGVDVAGPYWVKHGGRSRAKRWIVLFVCAQYRCVHIEPLASMDTASFLAAFTRFHGRRPRPNKVRSDNGTNFVGANTLLQELWNNLDAEQIRGKYPRIEWIFNPPRSPHMGGFFERLIGTMKRALEVTLPAGEITDEEFATILVGVEAAMNSRPLAHPSAGSPSDGPALTPGHFLMGSQYPELATLPKGKVWNVTQRWQHLQQILDAFWSRFVKELVPQYHKMNKLTRKTTVFQAGDLVLLLEGR